MLARMHFRRRFRHDDLDAERCAAEEAVWRNPDSDDCAARLRRADDAILATRKRLRGEAVRLFLEVAWPDISQSRDRPDRHDQRWI